METVWNRNCQFGTIYYRIIDYGHFNIEVTQFSYAWIELFILVGVLMINNTYLHNIIYGNYACNTHTWLVRFSLYFAELTYTLLIRFCDTCQGITPRYLMWIPVNPTLDRESLLLLFLVKSASVNNWLTRRTCTVKHAGMRATASTWSAMCLRGVCQNLQKMAVVKVRNTHNHCSRIPDQTDGKIFNRNSVTEQCTAKHETSNLSTSSEGRIIFKKY